MTARVAAGVPTGGQFAASSRSEAAVTLDQAAASTPQQPVYDTLDDLERAGYVTDEWSRWQQGGCAAYAVALVDAHPHLRFAVMGSTSLGGGDASQGWSESHAFAHDDHYAYDSAGRHPLPYLGVRADNDYVELDSDPDWYGYRDEWDADDPIFTDALAHANRHDILNREPVPLGGLRAPEVPDLVDPGPPPGTGWHRRVSEYTGLVSYDHIFPVTDGTATHTVSGMLPDDGAKTDGDAVVLGSGGITISQGSKVPGQIHYKILDAPLLDADGQPTGERVKAIYVNWVEVSKGTMPNKGKGWATAMYTAIRDAHPDCIIPAAANLEAPGKRLVKHYRDKHPETHTGRFDTDCRIHPTTGSTDKTYRAEMLLGPTWQD